MKWLKRFSRKRFDVEQALRDMLQRGIEIGKRQAEPMIIDRRSCRLHPIVLLIEIGTGLYECPMCREEKHTGPMRLRSGELTREWARSHTRPSTQEMDSIYWRNHKGETR